MQTTERYKARPVIEAEREAQVATRRAQAAETALAAERAAAALVAASLAEMREDRDRWRVQAERLAGAPAQLKAPAQQEGDMDTEESSDLLSGCGAIARHLHLSERQARHLAEIGAIPTFKLPGSSILRARRSNLTAWLAEREAAASAASQGGR